jgi:hypothetical protein
MAQISKRAMSSITDYQTGIPDIFDNVYDAETNPSGVISLALSENVSVSQARPSIILTVYQMADQFLETKAFDPPSPNGVCK